MDDRVFMIGISGGSGSGKTTFAKKVVSELSHTNEVTILHMDSYYLPEIPQEVYTPKNKINFDHPGSFDWDLLKKHLVSLKNQEVIDAPTYDFHTNSRMNETKKIAPTKIVIFEGIFTLFDPLIRELSDIKVFLHVEADIRFTRRLHRDVKERGRSLESVISQYYDSVRPMYQKYLEPQKQYADFIVGEETDNAAKILAARLKELINE